MLDFNKKFKFMRHILYTSFFTAITFCFGCKKLTEQTPFTSIDPKDAFATPDKIEKSSLGMYDALQDAEFLGGRALIYADIRGNDVKIAPYFGNVSTFNMLSSDVIALNCWAGGYKTIYATNLFRKNLALYGTGKIPEASSKQYIAESKFIRALCYFYLVNLYAQPYNFTNDASHLGVPLVLEASTDPFSPANKVARNTVKEVYDQMIKDLTEAFPDLPATYSNVYFDRARATKGAAQGLLARIYLYKQDWGNAIAMCDNVKALGYQLSANAYDNWVRANYISAANKERIFSVAMNNADNPNTNNAIGQHYGARRDISISSTYLSLPNFDNTDARKSAQFIRTVSGNSYTGKYFDNINDSWVPVLRYAEILLIKAEALAQKNAATADPAAIDILKQIRARSSATALTPTTQAALLTNIWDERRMELAFEGHGSFDFLRTKRDIPARLPDHPLQSAVSNFIIFPIPIRETQQNPNLKQNLGY